MYIYLYIFVFIYGIYIHYLTTEEVYHMAEKKNALSSCKSEDNRQGTIPSVTEWENDTVIQENLSKWRENIVRKKVAIVGGGAAGITALKYFLDNGFEDVILLEAQDTLGGRIRTFRQGNLHLEDGAEWIHGEKRNIVFRIAKSLKQLRRIASEDTYEFVILREDGTTVEDDLKLEETVRAIMEEINENGILENLYHDGYGQYFVRRFSEETEGDGHEEKVLKAWLHFMEQSINSDEGTGNWNDISARDADLFVDFGDDWKWQNGYDTLVQHLSKTFTPSNCRLNTPVKYVLWGLDDSEEVLLITNDDECIAAEKVIITVSVGCLKKWKNCMFKPSIPNPLNSALQEIELGNSNKIFMGWPKRWWGNKPLSCSILWTKFNLTESLEWLYGIVEIHSVEEEQNVLQAFISGKFSLMMEEKENTQIKNDFLYLLRELFKNEIPEPSFFRRTSWNSNPWTYGSYGSYITPKGSRSGLHSRSIFRNPLKNSRKRSVLYWAGEHTHDARYGTVDGAMVSGVREANRILNQIKNA